MRAQLARMLLRQIELDTIDGTEHSANQERRAQLNCEYAAISAGQMEVR